MTEDDFIMAIRKMGLNEYQARQEWYALKKGTLDIAGAQLFNVTNQNLRDWKAQGVLLEGLEEKLKL